MDRIDLPLISGDVPLAGVFDRMAESGMHAAIVAVPGREAVLVTNHEVDDALERGMERASQLQGVPLHVAGAELERWESAMDDARVSYGVVAGPEGEFGREAIRYDGEIESGTPRESMVTVVTRHERLAYDIHNAGEVCRCRKNHRAPGGKECPYCGSVVRCA